MNLQFAHDPGAQVNRSIERAGGAGTRSSVPWAAWWRIRRARHQLCTVINVGNLATDLRHHAQELRQTHISWVFLQEDVVYKVKKPVAFGFLDFTSVEKRHTACAAEVELNRRLAPDSYLGVVPVVLGADGCHRFGGDGDVVDWAVKMRRLSDERRADVLLSQGKLGREEIDRIATRIAEFHASARSDDATFRAGAPRAILEAVSENFEQAEPALFDQLDTAQAREVRVWQHTFAREHAFSFERRRRERRCRDGHGDLKLEHCYLDGDGVTILDCIEFNEQFRFGDVALDLAFLSMDLCGYGRVDLAERLLATYAQVSNDYELYELIDFYESFRAMVRGKVAAIMADSEEACLDVRDEARRQARRYFLLSLAAERRSLLSPILVCVGGLIASGKSSIADRASTLLGAPVVSSDRVRKHLAGVSATTPIQDGAFAGAYDEQFTARVYAEVVRRARVVIASSRPVIVDASFRLRRDREVVRALARELSVPFCFVECRTDAETVRARLRERAKQASVSDGRLEVFDEFEASWEAVIEFTEDEHVVLDTAKPLAGNLDRLRAVLPCWPERLTD